MTERNTKSHALLCYSYIGVSPLCLPLHLLCHNWNHILIVFFVCIKSNYISSSLCYCGCVGANVPETEAGSGKGEVTSRAGALQEVFDAATDTLAKRWPLQGISSQVTATRQPDGPQAPATSLFRLTPRVYFSWPGPHGSTEENMAG